MECRTPQSHSSNPQTQTLLQNPKNHIKQKPMETFQKAIFKLVETQPNKLLTPARRTLLQDRLNQFVSQYKTPDHPPYSAMIERALSELNEKRGSNEDAISQFLKKEYQNLPWSHSVLLKHHLSKLCDSGDIIATHNHKYMLPEENPIPKSTTKVKKKPHRRRWKWDWERERNKRRKRIKKTKVGKVRVLAKHQESSEKEQKITENGTWAPHDAEEHNLSSPERPPGFEFVRVENLLPNLDKTEVEIASGEEFAKSKRALRQKMRWSRKFQEPNGETMNSVQLGNCPKLEERKGFPFLNEHKPQEPCRSRRSRPKYENFLDLLGPEYDCPNDRPKRALRKRETINLDYTDESEHEFEVKQLPKRRRRRRRKSRILKLEPDATDVGTDEESRQDCASLFEKMEALKTEERPRKRQIGRPPKRRSPRLQKDEQ